MLRSNEYFIEVLEKAGDFQVVPKDAIVRAYAKDRAEDLLYVTGLDGKKQEFSSTVIIEYDDTQRGLAAIEILEDWDDFVDRLMLNNITGEE